MLYPAFEEEITDSTKGTSGEVVSSTYKGWVSGVYLI